MSDELENAILAGLRRDATMCVLSDWSLRNAARRCAEEVLKVVRVQPKGVESRGALADAGIRCMTTRRCDRSGCDFPACAAPR